LRNRALRHRLTRRLLDDPVVYYEELAEDERGYLVGQRHAITRRIEDATGLVSEMRAEGIAMVDPDDELTDVRMPEQRTDGHVTLLVAEYLATRDGPCRWRSCAPTSGRWPGSPVLLASGRHRTGGRRGTADHRAGEAARPAARRGRGG